MRMTIYFFTKYVFVAIWRELYYMVGNLFAFSVDNRRINFRNGCLPTMEGSCVHNGAHMKWLVDVVGIGFAMQRCRKYLPEALFLLYPFPSSLGWSCLSCGIKVLVLYMYMYLLHYWSVWPLHVWESHWLCSDWQQGHFAYHTNFISGFIFHGLCVQSCIVQLDYMVV